MPNNIIEKQIQDRVEGFVAELSELVKQAALEAVHGALGGGTAPVRRGRPRKSSRAPARRGAVKRKASKTGKRVKRSAVQVDAVAARILNHVKANAGTGVTEMSAALGLTPKEMRLPILKLLADKKLRTVGQRRGTKYHAAGGGPGRKTKTKTKTKAKPRRKKAKKTAKRTKRGRKKARK